MQNRLLGSRIVVRYSRCSVEWQETVASMPSQVEDAELEMCWKAWEKKNRLHDERIKERICSSLWGVATLLAVIVFFRLF